MPDVQRTVAEIDTLLADNTAGNISPQDLRDAFESWRNGHGQIYVKFADTADVTITDSITFFEVTVPVWTVTAGLHFFDESQGNGRLTYIGIPPVVVHVACTFSFTSPSNNQHLDWALGLSGVVDEAAELHIKLGTGADENSSALHLVTTMATNSYISLFVKNQTSTANVTVVTANIQAMTMPT